MFGGRSKAGYGGVIAGGPILPASVASLRPRGGPATPVLGSPLVFDPSVIFYPSYPSGVISSCMGAGDVLGSRMREGDLA